MADIIQLLPDSVANQIAAGEVVQRPASVIKELMENSVDAGATEISVYLIDAGKTSIQVVDNGKGMSETDARMAFERHATSKIREAADLFNLHTMGFRGEALASIAAVAQVELRTRQAGEELGVFLSIEGARVLEQKPVGCPVGANFTINNLFFNVPARRRFLKSNQTETNNVMTEFERVALIHPEISFAFYRDGEQTLNLRASSFRKRIISLFGSNMDKQLLPLAVETELVKISGFVGTPQSARVKGAHQFFFVNGRYMRHPHFARAIQVAFERLIPQDRQVPFFLAMEVDASRIDVNIHPTKTEIKFADEQAIWQILLAASREALGKFNAVPTLDFTPTGVPEMPVFDKPGHFAPPSDAYDRSYNPFRQGGGNRAAVSHQSWEELYASLRDTTSASPFDAPALPPDDLALSFDPTSQDAPSDSATLYGERTMDEQCMWNQEQMVFIQHAERYLVTSVKSGLMIIDQHRASVRINYDKYIQQLQQRDGVSQGLLFTESLQIPATQIKAFNDYLPDFRAVGFDITDEGHGNYAITGVPAGTESQHAVTMVLDIFDDLLAHVGQPQDKVYHTIALSLASKNVVRHGQILNATEIQGIINALFACPNPNYTPDGKNILSVFGSERIETLFR